MTRSRTSPAALARAERESRAVELKRDGLDYRAIARELDVSLSTAHSIVRRALDRIPTERVHELRKVEAARLDQLWAAGLPGALTGDHQTISALVRVSARRAALLGLDAEPASDSVTTVLIHPNLLPAGVNLAAIPHVYGGSDDD